MIANVTKLRTLADYIEVEQRDIDFAEQLEESRKLHGEQWPIVSMIAEFRERVVLFTKDIDNARR
jgi:hypothetical protein